LQSGRFGAKMAKLKELERLETELKIRGFSPKTISMYIFYNLKFLEFTKKEPDQMTEDDVRQYIGYLVVDKRLAPSSVTLVKAAIRFLYEEVLKKAIVNVKTPKNHKTLPVVLTRQEVKKLIEAAGSKSDKLMLILLYSSGLRLSEAINLKYENLELKEKMGWVRRGKGGKDRMFILSDMFVKELEKYMAKEENKGLIFVGKDDTTLSPRYVQRLVKQAALRADIKKDVHPHTLRHSFATHLLESGVGIRQIQELLGHSNLQTTQIYTSVSTEELKKIKSPLDSI
jgi:integrase/recombinase XerD